jgi:hypothetical protein
MDSLFCCVSILGFTTVRQLSAGVPFHA